MLLFIHILKVFCLKYKTLKQPSLNLDHTQRSFLVCLTIAFSHQIHFLGFTQIMLCQPLLRQNMGWYSPHGCFTSYVWCLTGHSVQRSYEWELCCAPLKRVCVSFYGLQEVGCLCCSFGVCTRVCVDKIHMGPFACVSRLRIYCRRRKQEQEQLNFQSCAIYDNQSGYSHNVRISDQLSLHLREQELISEKQRK